jgi:hypothetical protein
MNQGPTQARAFIIDTVDESGVFRVVPPVVIVRRQDTLTFRNLTQYDAMVDFHEGGTNPNTRSVGPHGEASFEIVGEDRLYPYEVLMDTNARIQLRAQGNSGPKMIIDG